MRLDTDPYLQRYASRVRGMRASEIRALFAVASRPEIVSFAGGMPYTAALDFQAVEDVALEVIRKHGPTALQYGGGQGRPELRERLVDVMASEGVPGHTDDLIITVGGQQGLELITKVFIDPGDIVLAEGPTYVGALGAFASHQTEVRHVLMDGQGLVPEALEDALRQLESEGRRCKFLYTVPNHQNPAGVSLTEDRRRRIVEICEAHDLLILEDNPYGLLSFDGSTNTSLRELAPDRVIYLSTVSKTFAPGARIGWIAAPHPVRDKLILLREAADLCPSNLTQMIVETWLRDQDWMAQVDVFRGVYRERATATLQALDEFFPDGCRWTQPVGGFYIWATLPEGVDTSALLAKAVSQHRVAYVPGRGFYDDGVQGSNQMRICYSYPPVERIREGIESLGGLLTDELELVRAVLGDGDDSTTSRVKRSDGEATT